MASIASIITLLDTQIAALLADTDNITSYTLGEKKVNKTEALNALISARVKYAAMDADQPYEDIRGIAWDISEFGEEEVEFIGDEN